MPSTPAPPTTSPNLAWPARWSRAASPWRSSTRATTPGSRPSSVRDWQSHGYVVGAALAAAVRRPRGRLCQPVRHPACVSSPTWSSCAASLRSPRRRWPTPPCTGDSTRAAAGSRSSTTSACNLSSTLELRDVLLPTAYRMCETGSTPACDIYLLSGSDLLCVASVKQGQIVDQWEGTVTPLANWSAVELAIAGRTTVQLSSLDDPRRNAAEIEELRGYGYQAELIVPLVAKGRVIGVVELLDFERRQFSTGRGRHRRSGLPRGRPRHRQCQPVRSRSAAPSRDRAAQRHRPPYGLEPAARRDRRRHDRRAPPDHRLRARRPGPHRPAGNRLETIYSSDRVLRKRRPEPPVARAARRPRRPFGANGSWSGRRGRRRRSTAARRVRRRRRRQHRPAARRRAHRRARPGRSGAPRVRVGRPSPARAGRHAPVAGHQQRAPLRRDQAAASEQPQGAQLGAERQGLLHPRPRRPRGRLHAPAGPRAGLARASSASSRRRPTCTTSARSA